MKNIALIGSTGSIGVSTLTVAKHLGKEKVNIVSLATGSNIELLEKQVKEFEPACVAIYDEEKAKVFKKNHPHLTVLGGMEGVLEAASHSSANLCVSAISGTRGIAPTIAAIEAGIDVALANKEALVSAGKLIMSLAKKKKVQIFPIDSEHSAIFQCIQGEEHSSIQRIILTASGGPFLHYPPEKTASIQVKDALKHNYVMGAKNTIDSSTLMNKGLEVIEARWLFDIAEEKIKVVVHPQSVIHSMVEFVDGSIKAQMSIPTMLVPIQYALTYPNRIPGIIQPFDFIKNNKLEFYPPDFEKFKCLKIAFDSLKLKESFACYMNAANEIFVNRFLKNEISWNQISEKLETILQKHEPQKVSSLEEILHIDTQARLEAMQF